jgi:pantoate--beta-alanine ligase
MTRLLRTRAELAAFLAEGPSGLGFVPTMGALHEGHLELVRRADQQNQRVLVSIFVNPTQFENPEDLAKYPQTLDADMALLAKAGVDACFAPTAQEIYPSGYAHSVQSRSETARELEGAARPGHFDGMLTVVLKLLLFVSPSKAYFGEKDYQQLLLVQALARDFALATEIVACPTVRESDGLALSSRNQRLSPQERERAPEFARLLKAALPLAEIRAKLTRAGFGIDYVEEHYGRRLGAVRLGAVRLIDNVSLEEVGT